MHAHTNQQPQIVLGKTLFIFSPSVCSPSRTFSIGDGFALVLISIMYGQCIVGPVPTSAIRIWSIGGCLGRAEIHDRARAFSTASIHKSQYSTF